MAELRVAFWNVQNLFEPGVTARGPQSDEELAAKVGVLADVIASFFDGRGPHLLGLAEVGSRSVLERIRAGLAGDFIPRWVPAGMPTDTGLAVLADTSVIADIQLLASQSPSKLARPRCMLSRCFLRQRQEPFLLALNHWKSRRPSGDLDDGTDRNQTAQWLGDRLARETRDTCVVAIGDFNTEPFEPPFSETRLRSVRHFSTALWAQATPAYLYNASWRFLAEPDCWETARERGYQEPRPRTSHDTSPPVIFDQLLVSGGALRGGPIRLREGSVRYHCDDVTAIRNSRGRLTCARWHYNGLAGPSGASDHFPLLAVFDVV